MGLRRTGAVLLAALVLAATAACSGGSTESASDLLKRAKKTLDSASSVHFVLTSDNVPTGSSGLVGGEGDVARPASFDGTLQVLASGSQVKVAVISAGGTVYAKLPFTTTYSVVDPAAFGVGDPATLLDPKTGISQFLVEAQSPKLGDEKRVNGEVVREVTASIPGDLVDKVLTTKDPQKPVQATFSIATDSGELRRAELTGPFFAADKDATYILDLSKFGEDVTITAPPTG